MFTSCRHNEVDSLNHRVFRQTVEPSPELIDYHLLDKCIDDLVGELSKEYNPHITVAEVFEALPSKVQGRYRNAYSRLNNRRYKLNEIAEVTAFVKTEQLYKYCDYPDQFTKSSRMIMGRDPRFTLVYAMLIQRVEEAMKGLKQYASGKNMFQLGEMFESLVGQKYAKSDYTAQEAHKRPWFIRHVEIEVVRRLMLKHEQYDQLEMLETLIDVKLSTSAHTQHGVKFSFTGCQISGDRDTKVLNTIGNWILCRYFRMWHNKYQGYEMDLDLFFCLGDDGVNQIPFNMVDYVDTFAHFGFEVKFEIVDNYHQVDFCSSKFIQYQPGKFVLVPHLGKTLSKLGAIIRAEHLPYLSDYYASLGYMYMVVYRNVPVLYDIGCWMRACVKGRHFVNTRIFSDVSYGLLGAFEASKGMDVPIVDVDLVLADYAMAYDFTYADYQSVLDFCSIPLQLPPENIGLRKSRPRVCDTSSLLTDPRDLVSFDVDVARYPRNESGGWGGQPFFVL